MTAQPLYYPFPVRHVAIRHDIKVAYCDEGSGKETLLFIHGLANYIPVWKHQIKELSRHHRCIALDLPGNGLSSGGNYPYTLFFYAECVKLFADKLGLENIVLAGHSMGGQISVVLGLRYPELINKIILIAPAGIEYFNSLEAAR